MTRDPVSGTPSGERLPGPDVVRAVAMLGVVVMNYHGYLLLRGGRRDGGWLYDLLDPRTGALTTRFAATFVLTAGVGVTLLTRSAIGDPARVASRRWLLARRGLLLYGAGLAFDFVWSGSILPFYGAMFVVAALIFSLRDRWVIAIGTVAAVAGWLIRWWRYERELDGGDTRWLTDPASRSPRGLVLDVFVNGTHPLLPWLAFLCAGIVLGRYLTAPGWRRAAIGLGLVSFALGTLANGIASGPRAGLLLSDDPFDRGIAYTASALGTALIAFAGITWLADRHRTSEVTLALRQAGQLSLTIYVAHALVFNLLVDWLDVVEPGGVATSLTFAFVVWGCAIAGAIAYQRRFGQGPVEYVYRRLTA